MLTLISKVVEFAKVSGLATRNRIVAENIQTQTTAINALITQFRTNVGEEQFKLHMGTLLSLHNIAPNLDTARVMPATTPVMPAPAVEQQVPSPVTSDDSVSLSFIDGNMSSIGTATVTISQDPHVFLVSILNAIPEAIRQNVSRVWVSQSGKLIASYNYDRINNTLARV